jgi:hypothetical protein
MRVAFSCVVDAQPKFEWQGLLWAQSLLRNAGARPEDLFVHCMAGVTKSFREAMGRMNVRAVDIQPFDGGHAYCNKIQQCFSGVFNGYDKVILLDADLYFLAPPRIPDSGLVAGKIVDMPNPPLVMLRALYEEAHVQAPEEISVDCALSADEKTFKHNLNGGYYVIDAGILDDLGRLWKKHALWLVDRIDRLGTYSAHVDQIAMSLSLSELRPAFSLLSAQANFPVHLPVERLSVLSPSPIDALHYHWHVLPSGAIKTTGLPLIDEAIAKANEGIAAIIADNFDNTLFWNNRYACFPELGSGIGSRGDTLAYKKKLLSEVLAAHKNKTVLEIGCGDLETSRDLDLDHYVGADLSATALEIARQKRPDWQFVLGTIGASPELVEADVVMCLDVLIHQKRVDDYRSLVAALAKGAKQGLVVSGYDAPPTFVSNIIAYHEPLSQTLRDLGAFAEISEVGKYRDTSVLVAVKKEKGDDQGDG